MEYSSGSNWASKRKDDLELQARLPLNCTTQSSVTTVQFEDIRPQVDVLSVLAKNELTHLRLSNGFQKTGFQ